jgi:prevent-host-death family protein
MKTVGVAELKNRLSHYLAGVQRGEEILIRDHNRLIARLVPLPEPAQFSEEELALAAAGILRLPERATLPDDFWTAPRPKVATQEAVQAVVDERKENRY